jgi:predicted membrane-bound spermidine synthase
MAPTSRPLAFHADPRPRPRARWPWLLLVFVEGFASLGVEIIALRRLLPFMGSSISVTAPTIGLFLLALTAGYWVGGRAARADVEARVARNLVAAATIAGVGSSSVAVRTIFEALPLGPAYLVYMLGIVCPSAWLLAQTVPLVVDRVAAPTAGEASGVALTASTLGSFLGAVGIALVVMPWIGVTGAVLLCAASLVVGVLATGAGRRPAVAAAAVTALAVPAAAAWLPTRAAVETAYADYRVTPPATGRPVTAGHQPPVRVFEVNGQSASLLDSGSPPRRALYVEHLQRTLVTDLGLRGGRVLVLGAGGFTLSLGDPANHYTYVDIDPAIRAIAEQRFLGRPIDGEFVVDDARHHVAHTPARYDAVVIDVYTAHASVPSHLVTREFWQTLPRVLPADGGAVLVNLVLDAKLRSPYARNLLATIEAALGRCEVDVLEPTRDISNVIVTCRASAGVAQPVSIYTDERNRVDLDRNLFGF